MANENLVLFGVGDTAPSHEPVEGFVELARPTLAKADICIAQCERLYTERGAPQVHVNLKDNERNRLKPHMAAAFDAFNVVSMASNHVMDWGDEGLMDTIDLLRKKGLKVIGAGRNLEEARQPAIIEKNGVRVAILGYCSVLRYGYAATKNKPGSAPLRADTYFRVEHYYPGFTPKIITIPNEEDLAGMVDDIAKAKKQAHAVVVIMHWGLSHVPRVVPDYQPTAAKAAFEAGADLIIGHHPHMPKPIGVYGGKVCFHSVGNFMTTKDWKEIDDANPNPWSKQYGLAVDPDFINLSHGHPDARRGMIAKAVISRNGLERVSFLPILIDKQLRPEVLLNGDPRFDDAVKYMEWSSEGYNHKFTVEGNEVVVTGA